MNYAAGALGILTLYFALEKNGVSLLPMLVVAGAGVALLARKPKGETGWRWQFSCVAVWFMTALCAWHFYRP